MPRENFNVIIMHGNKEEYKKVKQVVQNLGFTPILLKEKYDGQFLLDKIRHSVWEKAHCAIVIMSPDDVTEDKNFRARQNVIFELGYCLAAFDSIPDKYWYNAVIVLMEKSVEKFSDIGGMQYIEYASEISDEQITVLSKALNRTFRKASRYYDDEL